MASGIPERLKHVETGLLSNRRACTQGDQDGRKRPESHTHWPRINIGAYETESEASHKQTDSSDVHQPRSLTGQANGLVGHQNAYHNKEQQTYQTPSHEKLDEHGVSRPKAFVI